MDRLALAALLLFLLGAVSPQVVVNPETEAVLRTSDAKFNCSTRQVVWTSMIWTLNRRLAVTIVEGVGALNSSERFSAVDFSMPAEAKWQFIIRNVSRNDSGQVSCQVQGSDSVTATLSVQESGSVEIMGSNRTVMEGDQVVFQCLAAGWFPTPQISWTVGGKPVDQQLFNTSSEEVNTLVNSNSTFRLTAVTNVSVECLVMIPALRTPLSSTSFLVVEKVAKPARRDDIVLIAVLVPIFAVLLLIIIIILIVFCCKRRRKAKSGYQDEARAHTRSRKAGDTHTGDGQGQDNLGYVTETKANDYNSEITDSGFRQTGHISTIQLPDMINDSQGGRERYANIPLADHSVRKHRHATIV